MNRVVVACLLGLVAGPQRLVAQSVPADTAARAISLSLDALVERAIATSTAVRMAEARRTEADAAIGSARAARRPTITANAQFAWQPSASANASGLTWAPDPTAPLEQRVRYLELASPTAALAVLNPQILASAAQYAWIGGMSGQGTLFDGGRTRAAVAAATARRNAADAVIEAERSRARLDAELAYRQLQVAREHVETATQARDIAAGDRDVMCARWARGQVSELDVLRSEMTQSDLERRLADARAAERSAEQRLRRLGDLPTGGELRLTTPVEPGTLAALASTDPTDLLEAVQQAELRSAESTVAAAMADARATRASRRPSLVLRADLQAIRAPEQPFALGGAWQDVQTITAGLQIPIVRAGQRSAERAAEARVAQARVDAKRVADGTRFDRESVSAERARAGASWRASQERLSSAERVAELTTAALGRGIATPSDEARARLDVVDARAQVLQSLVDYLSADAVAGEAGRGNTALP